ncbi:hypothetical protein [Clostridium sp.]|uniref:hypothetical protein n=1 Tax=Clostridium sp. TaxID=1506 RepID=UPI002FCA63CB
MSISLALVPLVLVLRVAIGEKELDDWVDSAQIRLFSYIQSEDEFRILIKKSGYNVVEEGRLTKIHINDKGNYCYIDKINNNMAVTFDNLKSVDIVREFTKNIKNTAQREVFEYDYRIIEEGINNVKEKVFQTNFVDKEILLNVLEEYGIIPIINSRDEIQCTIEGTELTFSKENKINYEVKIKGVDQLAGVLEHINFIDEEYRKNVQSYTYSKVVEKLQGSNMKIESEEVMEDNSLVLTINLD